MPLDRITPTKPAHLQPDSVDRAERLMRAAAAGEHARRGPITVRADGEGYVIVDGNATFAVADRHGWSSILVLEEG